MIKNISKYLLIASLVFGASSINANEEVAVTSETIQTINEDAKAAPQKSQTVKQAISEYLRDKKIKKGYNRKNNKYIVTAIVPVGFAVNDPQFNDALVVAYEEAYMKAQTDLLMDIYGKTTTDKAVSMFRLKDPNAQTKFIAELDEAKNNKARTDTIFEKVKKLTEVKLDNALKEEGVNPEQIKTLDVKKKQDLFRKTFVKNVANGFDLKKLVGSVPIQTFVGVDKRGQAEFGLVMMKSDVTERIAMDMANKRAARDKKATGVNPLDLLPTTPKDFLKEFGVRIFFDESGLPSLISYSQYYVGNAEKDDADMLNEDKNIGMESAKMSAKAQLAEFMKVVVSANKQNSQRKTKIKRLENEIDKTTNEEVVVEKEINEIVKSYQSTAKSQSSMDNAGTETIYDWEYETETGDIFVGVVERWSYEQLASAEAMKSGKNVNYTKGSNNVQKTKNELKNIKKSKDVVDTNDF